MMGVVSRWNQWDTMSLHNIVSCARRPAPLRTNRLNPENTRGVRNVPPLPLQLLARRRPLYLLSRETVGAYQRHDRRYTGA